MPTLELTQLRQLMGAYFHQDFYDEYGGVMETVDAFVDDDATDVPELLAEIAWVLDAYPAERDVEDLLDSLGCEYRADPADGGYRGWLTQIARRLAATTAH